MPASPKAFVWYELMTTDVDGAKAFYAAVNGWQAQEVGQPDCRYIVMSAGARMVAGVMPIPAEVQRRRRSAGLARLYRG